MEAEQSCDRGGTNIELEQDAWNAAETMVLEARDVLNRMHTQADRQERASAQSEASGVAAGFVRDMNAPLPATKPTARQLARLEQRFLRVVRRLPLVTRERLLSSICKLFEAKEPAAPVT
jgi:hypothetical protein